MINQQKVWVVVALSAGAVCMGAIIQAVIPQVVPIPNKRGNSTVFALATSATPGSAGTTVCDDGSGNFGTTGCLGIPPIFSQTNSVTDSVMTTETSLTGTGAGSNVLTANSLGVGTALRFAVSGFYSTTASPGTITIKVKTTGGVTSTVTLGNTGAITPPNSVTTGVWRLWGDLTCRTTGTGGTLIVNTILEFAPSSLSTLTPGAASIANTTAATVDTTAAQTFDVTAAWSAASQSITSTNYVLASIGAAGGGGGSGTVNTGTQFQVGEYTTAGNAISGVSIPNCPDTGGNHVNFANGTGVFTCGTTASSSGILSNVGAFSTRAGSGTNTGDLFSATDSPISSIWTGAAWSNFAFHVPVTLPTPATFGTAVNVGTSTITNTTGPVVLTHSDATNVVGWVTSIFTNTGAFFFNIEPAVHNSFQSGVMFRESSSGKLLVFTIAFTTSTTQINVDRWSSATSFNANVFRQTYQPLSAPFFALRLRVVGTALDCDVSWDAGQHWLLVYTETKTAFFTTAPDQDGPATVISGDVETLYNYSTT